MAKIRSSLNLKYNNQTIKQVLEFMYLGSTIYNSGSCQREVKLRIGQANAPFRKLSQIWRSKKYSFQLKLRLFNNNILSTLCFDFETWLIDKLIENKLLAFENRCLRQILKIHWFQKVRNTSIQQKTSQSLVTKVIQNRKWRYLCHVICVPET